MTIQQRLGIAENTKLLMIHADDAGLCHSENLATIQAVQNGSLNSYSIMVPCQGFEEIAKFALLNPQYDYGIHLTLTCEWQNYKWSPILPSAKVSSLIDAQGYFHGNREEVKKKVVVAELKNELRAQIEKSLDYGLKPSHLDSHMYTLALKDEFLAVYKELGAEFKLPILLNNQFVHSFGLDLEVHVLEGDFWVENDVVLGTYEYFEKGLLLDFYKSKLNNLPNGLTLFLVHTAFDTNEMQKITVNHPNFGAKWRQLDYDFVCSDICKEIIKKNNIQLISWTEIKQLIYP